MSEDLIYEMLRIFGYRNAQKEIARVRDGIATPDDKHALIDEIRMKCSLANSPQPAHFANYTEYLAAKAKYDSFREQLREIGRNYNADSETSELAKITKKIKSEIVKKPVEDVEPKAVANPNLNKDKFHPRDDHRTIV